MSGQGYGIGWGAAPYGSGVPVEPGNAPLPITSQWDLADLDAVDLSGYSGLGNVSAEGVEVLQEGLSLCGLGITPAYVSVEALVPGSCSMEVELTVAQWPVVAPTENEHLSIAVTDQQGCSVAVSWWLSGPQVIMRAGHTLRIPFPQIGTEPSEQVAAPYLSALDPFVVRVVVDEGQQACFVFCTPRSVLNGGGAHELRIVLPYSSNAPVGAIDGALVVAKSMSSSVCADLLAVRLSSTLFLPGRAPVARPGQDRSALLCSIVKLDGSQSFDVEGAPLTYLWRLVDAPTGSRYIFEALDGVAGTAGPGLHATFTSVELAVEHAFEPLAIGDVLVVGSRRYDIVSIQPSPFVLTVDVADFEEGTVYPFKVLRQRAIRDPDTVTPALLPDVLGLYRIDLVVDNGLLRSSLVGELPPSVVLNVRATALATGLSPNLAFMWQYLSDFWRQVEDTEPIQEFWAGTAQVLASQLYRLYQHEYGKSLRTVPRVFGVRWIHYDGVLAEPLPELTSYVLCGGAMLSPLYAPGHAFTSVDTFTNEFSSPGWDEPYVWGLAANGLTLQQVANLFTQELRLAGRPLVARVRQVTAGEYLEVMSSDWVVAAPGGWLQGSTSVRTGTGRRAGLGLYEVQQNLTDMQAPYPAVVFPDDDQFFTIQSVRGTEYGTALVLDRDPPEASTFRMVGTVRSELLNFWAGLVTSQDPLWLEVTDDDGTTAEQYELVRTTVEGCSETRPTEVACDLGAVHHLLARGLEVRHARTLRRRYIPVDPLVVSIPTLREQIVVRDQSAVLRENLDYFVEEARGQTCVRFVVGTPDIWEGLDPPFRLWAEYTFVDNSPFIEGAFGIPAGLTVERLRASSQDIDYLSAVQGLWYAYLGGPTIKNLRAGVQIFLGLPFAERAGVITEIETEVLAQTSRITIQDSDGLSYQRQYPTVLPLELNPATGELYQVGDSVAQFAPLVRGAEVVDYVSDPQWFVSLVKQGLFAEAQKYHTFLVKIDSAIYTPESFALVQEFVQALKPSHTSLQMLVQQMLGSGTEINVHDVRSTSISLLLRDALHTGGLSQYGAARRFDEIRAATGAVRNQFDIDQDPTNVAPILWGFDKEWVSPKDEQLIIQTFEVDDYTPARFDMGLRFDKPIEMAAQMTDPVTSLVASAGVWTTVTAVALSYGGLTKHLQYEVRLQGSMPLGDSPAVDYRFINYSGVVSPGTLVLSPSPTGKFYHRLIVPGNPLVDEDGTSQFQLRFSWSGPMNLGAFMRVTMQPLDGSSLPYEWRFDTDLPVIGTYIRTQQVTR